MAPPIDIEEALQRVREQREHLDRLEAAYRLVAEDQARLKAAGTTIQYALPGVDGIQGTSAHKSKAEFIREAIMKAPGEFDVNALYDLGVPQSVSRQDVSFTLSRFKRSGFIEVVVEGSGKKPSIFRLKSLPLPGDSNFLNPTPP